MDSKSPNLFLGVGFMSNKKNVTEENLVERFFKKSELSFEEIIESLIKKDIEQVIEESYHSDKINTTSSNVQEVF